jgi:hypothetical protein
MTEALRQLLAEEEARMLAAREAVMAIAARVAAMPDLNDMSDDEILGYDADGIPSR